MKKILFIGLTWLLVSQASILFAEPTMSPTDLLAKMDEILRGKSHEMKVSMQVKTPRWERSYKIRVWMKGVDYTFSRIDEPAKVKGQGFLRIQARLWQYLPSAERTVLIPPSLMLDNFMGSDFSNDDFVKMSYLPRDYEAKVIGEETINGFEAYRLELLPKPDAPVTYSKLEIWVRKTDSAPLRWDFFNEKKVMIRTLNYSDFKTFSGREVPSVWHMINHLDKGRETKITIDEAVYDQPIEDNFFTKTNLEKND